MNELWKKIKLNPNNPRWIKKQDFESLKKSIKAFPQMLEKRPVVYDETFTILGGNMRFLAMQALAQKDGFVIKDEYFDSCEGWSEEQKNEFIIKDNLGWGSWDWDKLANEWDKEKLEDWGMNPADWPNQTSNEYSQKLGEVVYEPKETKWKIKDLFEKETKFDAEIEEIENEELKEMLRARVAYFHNYNYAKIADYYAYQATPEEQRILEKLAFVLLDKDQLVELGFSKIIESLTKEDELIET